MVGTVTERLEEERPAHYRDWLVERLGRPMERALIRAEQRYTKLKPVHIRASQLHSAYRKKHR
jgi:hypothetical protein